MAFVYRTSVTSGAPYKERRSARLPCCQREGYCRRQMDIQWATRVAYARDAGPGPFVLTSGERAEGSRHGGMRRAASALPRTSATRRARKRISAGRHGHEPVLPSFSFDPSSEPAFASKRVNSRRRRPDSSRLSEAARIRMTERSALHRRVCGACRGVRGATPHKRRYAKIPRIHFLGRQTARPRAKRPSVSLIFIQNTLLSEATGCRLRDAPIRRGALFYSL